jgi:hypothetical protein
VAVPGLLRSSASAWATHITTKKSGQIAFGLAPNCDHQRVSRVVALALALLLSRGVAASAIASARALAKQL